MRKMRRGRLVAYALIAIAIAVLTTSCGDGGDGDTSSSSSPPSFKTQVSGLMDEMEDDLEAGDGAGICESLTAETRLEVATAGFQHLTNCAAVFEEVARQRRASGLIKRRSKVISTQKYGGNGGALIKNAEGSSGAVSFTANSVGGWALSKLESLEGMGLVRVAELEGPGHDFGDPANATDKGSVEEVVYDLQGDFPRGLGSSVCYELSAAGQREVESSGIGKGDCVKRIPEIAKRARANGMRPRSSRILSVRISGGQAVAVLRDPGGEPYRARLVDVPQDGWKMERLGYATGIDLERLR
jgi:hypothetical protein